MFSAKRRLLEILRATSYKSSEEPEFQLASGKCSRYYVDCKQALSYPDTRALIGDLIFDLVKADTFDAVGGLEIGAYPIATSVSDSIFRQTHRSVRAFVVRKEAKPHGVWGVIAGDVKRGDKALIVDDVVTVGSSTIKAIRSAREAGLIVNRVIVLVDREEENGRKNIEAEGVKFDALFTLSELSEFSNDDTETADATGYPRGPVRKQSGKTVVSR